MDEKQLLLNKWDEIKLLAKEEYDIFDVPFETWIVPLKVHSVENGLVSVVVPAEQSTGIKYISDKYRLPLKVAISEVMQGRYDVKFIAESDIMPESFGRLSYGDEGSWKNNTNYLQRSNLNPKYTFDTFVVGPNNRLAHSAALAVAEDPGRVYNPLFLYGGSGLGKTHLMHSIGHYIMKKNPNTTTRYVTAETFTNEVIESIKLGTQAMSRLREKYRSVDVLLLDDIQFIIGKESTQNEFFNTFNELHSQNKAIILSSDKPPKDMETLEDRLRSRFEWGIQVDINPPDYETRMAILRRYMETHGISIADEFLQAIATHIRSNIRDLEGALNKLFLVKRAENREITMEDTMKAVNDIVSSEVPKKITPEIIIDEVAKYYHTSREEIRSQKRNKEIVLPRQVSMYLIREMTSTALAEIGKILGDRDHTTVIHGHDKIADELLKNPSLKDDVDEIRRLISPD